VTTLAPDHRIVPPHDHHSVRNVTSGAAVPTTAWPCCCVRATTGLSYQGPPSSAGCIVGWSWSVPVPRSRAPPTHTRAVNRLVQGRTQLSRVMIVCPVKELPVPTKVEVEATRAFRKRVPESGTIDCVACGRRHSWYRPETFLEGQPRPVARRQSGVATPAPRTGWVMRQVGMGRR
jgi:hypothetical protein